MTVYTTLEGKTIDLGNLSTRERAFFDRVVQACNEGQPWAEIYNMVFGRQNPVVGSSGQITPIVWAHPLFRVVYDLQARAAIDQGKMAPSTPADRSATSRRTPAQP